MTTEVPPRPGLYLITPDETDTDRLLERVVPVLGPYVTWLQYRNKTAHRALRQAQARALCEQCRNAQIPFIVNDDLELAREIEADGVHLGEHDDDIAQARQRLGPEALIGASCYDDIDRAVRAVAAGASYVAFGAFFPTRNKQNPRRASPEILAAAMPLAVPRVAIGGITLDNIGSLINAGADLIAVIGAVFEAHDPAAAVRAFYDRMQDSSP